MNTNTVDGRTIAQYYGAGEVKKLAGYIESKRQNRVTRQSEVIAVRVLHQPPNTDKAEVVDLDGVEEILAHRDLSLGEQQALQGAEVACTPFKKSTRCVPLRELRLILSSQITQEDHTETIIDPQERMEWIGKMRDIANEAPVYGQILRLAAKPLDLNRFPDKKILPPAVFVQGQNGLPELLPGPRRFEESAIRNRVRERSKCIRQNGFLSRRPISPLLAHPPRMILAFNEDGFYLLQLGQVCWCSLGLLQS